MFGFYGENYWWEGSGHESGIQGLDGSLLLYFLDTCCINLGAAISCSSFGPGFPGDTSGTSWLFHGIILVELWLCCTSSTVSHKYPARLAFLGGVPKNWFRNLTLRIWLNYLFNTFFMPSARSALWRFFLSWVVIYLCFLCFRFSLSIWICVS